MAASHHPLPLSTSPPAPPASLLNDFDEEELPQAAAVEATAAVEEEGDSASLLAARAVFASYHVVYSPSYLVPVLLFRLSFHDGQPLSLEETMAALQRLADGRSRSLSAQGDETDEEGILTADFPPLGSVLHPSLGSPFLSLHPCQTSPVMAALQSTVSAASPAPLNVLAWLSAIGPFAGFRLPFTPALQAEVADHRRSEGGADGASAERRREAPSS